MFLQEQTTVFRNLCDSVDVDAELLEILLPYLQPLLAIGIDLNDLSLQQAIEAHFTHLEAACQAVLGYAGFLAAKKERFGSPYHATSCLVKALVERWMPHSNWQKLMAIAPHARYLSPYEEAYRLIRAIQQSGKVCPWNTEDLDRLSDAEIERMLPTVRQLHWAIAPVSA